MLLQQLKLYGWFLSYRYDYTREELSMVPREELSMVQSLALVILKTVRRI